MYPATISTLVFGSIAGTAFLLLPFFNVSTLPTNYFSFSFQPPAVPNLSDQQFYRRHFIPPSNVINRAESDTISYLKRAVSRALAVEPLNLPFASPAQGITMYTDFAKNGYHITHKLINPFCPTSMIAVPKAHRNLSMCLSLFENVYVGREGVVYQPQSRLIYDMGGGCCFHDWKRYLQKSVPISTLSERYPILLLMAFHHSITYFHVIEQLLPRFLLLLPLLDAEPRMYIVIDDSAVAIKLLTILGIKRSRILSLTEDEQWIQGAVVLQPPPIDLCRARMNCAYKSAKITASVLRDAVLPQMDLSKSLKYRPKLLLLERARWRDVDGSCKEQRCLKNFDALRIAIDAEFGVEYDTMVMRHNETMQGTIRKFYQAKVIVGVHGAGFQNMMYCRKGTTIVHIGWQKHYKKLADEVEAKYHLAEVPYLRRGSVNVHVDVAKIVSEVRKAIDMDSGVRYEKKSREK